MTFIILFSIITVISVIIITRRDKMQTKTLDKKPTKEKDTVSICLFLPKKLHLKMKIEAAKARLPLRRYLIKKLEQA